MSLLWTIAWGVVLGYFIIFIIMLICFILGWLFFGSSVTYGIKNVMAGTSISAGNFHYEPV